METTRENFGGKVDDMAGKAEQAAGRLGAGEQAGGMIHNVAEKAKDVAASVADYAGQARETVQGLASSAADSAVSAKDAVADWTSSAAGSTGDALAGAGDELTTMIRRYPIPALLVGVGIGFLLARLTTPSRNSY
jgi:hypothetical protein